MTGPVSIRDATGDDINAVADLFNALLATTTIGWRDEPTTTNEQLEWLVERDRRGYPTLVALADGDIVGYCCWSSFRGGERFAGYRHTVEHTVHVDGRHHRRGIGRLLLEALIHRAEAAEIHVMIAGIDAANQSSIDFHAAMGFAEVARMPETGRKFGRWLDLILMQRIIST